MNNWTSNSLWREALRALRYNLQPRRIHVYGIGAPKTGTASVARVFSDYRSRHEPRVTDTIELVWRKENGKLSGSEIRSVLQTRDRWLNLECEVAHYLIHFCEELCSLFPAAKFICTIRHPRSWLRSFIDQSINLDQNFSKYISNEEIEAWRCLRKINCGPKPSAYPAPEDPLAKYGLPSIDGYLSYWTHHNQQVLDVIPTDRRLLVRTCNLSTRVDDIRAFTGADGYVSKKPHVNRAKDVCPNFWTTGPTNFG
jgi:hypothetical protein